MFVTVVTVIALIASLIFNVIQYQWRREDKAEQKRRGDERKADETQKEQAPPRFFNIDGTPSPIRITGRQYSSQGPVVDLWCLVTIVNYTPLPMKITPRRLVIANEKWPVVSISFYEKSDTRNRSERISLVGNDKQDYELHFRFSENEVPTRDGELWIESDNRTGELSIPVSFPQ